MNIDPSRRFTTWARNEIWTGPSGTGNYVPNPMDLIFDVPANAVYKVVNVDYTTGLSQWQRFVFSSLNGATDEDVLIGIGPGASSETWRLHVSLKTVPFQCIFDLRLVIPGQEAAYIKVFKSGNYDDPSNIISGMYDQENSWTSDSIPVQGNGMYKYVPQFYLKEAVENGQPLYVLVYNSAGVSISEYRVLAHVTDFIPSGNVAVKHISNITLETKFLSETVTDLVQIPKNITLASLVLHARVHYSDGSKSDLMPVDGTKFTLLNIQPFIAGIEDQNIPVRLKYVLGPDESGDGVFTNANERFITRLYTFKVMPTDYSYSVKLMSFPDWNTSEGRYYMKSFVYTMDRDESYDVSNIIVFGFNGDPFTGVPGSGNRTHIISVDLEDIDPGYNDFRYIQSVPANLLAPGNSVNLRWRIQNDPQGTPYEALPATVVDAGATYTINVSGGLTTLNDWIEGLYLIQGPLFTAADVEPLDPTHFRVIFGSTSSQQPITNWNANLSFSKANAITTGRTIIIEFIRIDGGDTYVLGCAGLTATVS